MQNLFNSPFIYEVNLTVENQVFEQNKKWLIDHFHKMVIENKFSKLNLFFVKPTDPIEDSHLRYQKIVAQYYVRSHEILENYFEKQAKIMRNQVFEKLGHCYSVSRRILELKEVFNHEEC